MKFVRLNTIVAEKSGLKVNKKAASSKINFFSAKSLTSPSMTGADTNRDGLNQTNLSSLFYVLSCSNAFAKQIKDLNR